MAVSIFDLMQPSGFNNTLRPKQCDQAKLNSINRSVLYNQHCTEE